MAILHNHHIIPKHMGGSDDPSNLVYLTIEEHANAHKKLYEIYGKTEDYIAWNSLSGQMSDEELWYERSKLGGLSVKGLKRSKQSIENYKKSWTSKRKKDVGVKMSQILKGIPKNENHKRNMKGKRPHVNQTGSNNNNAKSVLTPYGIFGSSKDAHRYMIDNGFNIKYTTMMYKIYNKKDGFSHLQGEGV